jgi:hypothetical protein
MSTQSAVTWSLITQEGKQFEKLALDFSKYASGITRKVTRKTELNLLNVNMAEGPEIVFQENILQTNKSQKDLNIARTQPK